MAPRRRLKILVWSHFVPRFDKEWYDGYVQKWGEANGVKVTVDHINLAEILPHGRRDLRRSGHDLIEWIAPPSQFEPSVLDLGDIVKEAEKRYGKQHPLCRREFLQPELEEVLLPSAPAGRSTPATTGRASGRRPGKAAGRRRGRT